MDIHIPTLINLQLQELAQQQEREIREIIMDAITQYVEAHTNETQFRRRVQRAIDDHRWLLDELDKQ
jgi:predicted transcriptional regulator